jgi:hypothetical protein
MLSHFNYFISIILLAIILSGCSEELTSKGKYVKTGVEKPGDKFEVIKVIHANDGSGCGLLGESGSFESAQNKLRNTAAEIGATYVRIISTQTPKDVSDCLQRRYSITGEAYREIATSSVGDYEERIKNEEETDNEQSETLCEEQTN